MTQAFQSVSAKLDPLKRANSFEIFGFDFMITANFRVYLIEVNSNPAMDTRPGDHIMAQMIP
jgi:D-alanine-D-alanine ligase-like ATP-grasp enzyme